MRNRYFSRPHLLAVLTALSFVSATMAGNGSAVSSRAPRAGSAESAEVDNQIQGFTEPYADISMAAAEMGTLARVAVREGDVVTTGQLLASLDDRVLRASLNVAKAGMSATGELQSATTQLEMKKVELEKVNRLFLRQHASQKELDHARGEFRIAESRVQSVKEDLEIRRLEYAQIEAQLRQREIRSTIDGVVVSVDKDHGEFVSPSDPVVARVVQLDPLRVVFSVPNARRPDVAVGQEAKMKIGPEATLVSGQIEFVSPTADASSGSFRVKVRLPNSDRRWHGGLKTILVLDDVVPSFSRPKQIAKQTK